MTGQDKFGMTFDEETNARFMKMFLRYHLHLYLLYVHLYVEFRWVIAFLCAMFRQYTLVSNVQALHPSVQCSSIPKCPRFRHCTPVCNVPTMHPSVQCLGWHFNPVCNVQTYTFTWRKHPEGINNFTYLLLDLEWNQMTCAKRNWPKTDQRRNYLLLATLNGWNRWNSLKRLFCFSTNFIYLTSESLKWNYILQQCELS